MPDVLPTVPPAASAPPDIIPGDSPEAAALLPAPQDGGAAPPVALPKIFNPSEGPPDIIPADSPEAAALTSTPADANALDIIPADSPAANELLSKPDYLKTLPTNTDVVQKFIEDHPTGDAPDKKAYEDAFVHATQKGDFFGALPRAPGTPEPEHWYSSVAGIAKAAADFGESMWSGGFAMTYTLTGMTGGLYASVPDSVKVPGFLVPGFPTGSELALRRAARTKFGTVGGTDQQSKETQQDFVNFKAGTASAMIRDFAGLYRGAANLFNAGFSALGHDNSEDIRQQFNDEVTLQRALKRTQQGKSIAGEPVSDVPVDPQMSGLISQSPLADPIPFLLPYLKGAQVGAAETAGARAMTVVEAGVDTAPKSNLLSRAAARTAEIAAGTVKTAKTGFDAVPPAVRGAGAAAATLASGGGVWGALGAAVLGGSKYADVIDGALNTSMAALSKTSEWLRAPGPFSKATSAIYSQLAPPAKNYAQASLYMMPFALGAKDSDEAMLTIMGGMQFHAMGQAPGVFNSLSPVEAMWRAATRSPTERAPVSGGEDHPDLNAAHHDVMKVANNAGNNLVQAARNLLAKLGGGSNLYLGRPDALKSALLKMQSEGHIFLDPESGGKIDMNAPAIGPDGKPMLDANGKPVSNVDNILQQYGATLHVSSPGEAGAPSSAPAPRVTRSIALVPFKEGAPAISVGHELWHAVEPLLSPEERAYFQKETTRVYGGVGSKEFENARRYYAEAAGRDPVHMSDAAVASELMAENFSGRINALPVGAFGPQGDMTFKNPAYRKYVGAVASFQERILNRLGGKVPQTTVEVTRVDADGNRYKVLEPAGKGSKTTGLGFEASSDLGHIIDNFLESKRLDTHISESQGHADPFTEKSAPGEDGSPISSVREVATPPAFKKGDPIGEVKVDGTVFAHSAEVTKVIESPDGRHQYEIEYTDPKDGKRKAGTVPESALQSPVKPGAAAPKSPAKVDVGVLNPVPVDLTTASPTGAPVSMSPEQAARVQRAKETAQAVWQARRELDMVQEFGGTPEQIAAAKEKVFQAELAHEKYGEFGREGPNAAIPAKNPAKVAGPAAPAPIRVSPDLNAPTPEAVDLVNKADGGGAAPAFISNNLRKIARENGVEITSSMTPNDVVAALREKVGKNPPAPNVRVTPAQQAAFGKVDTGEAPPELQKTNTAVLKAAVAHPRAEIPAFEGEVRGAAADEMGPEADLRKAQRAAADRAEQSGFKNPFKRIFSKLFVPYKFMDGPTPRVFGFSGDKLIQNVSILHDWLTRTSGLPKLAKHIADPKFVQTFNDYLENQRNGYGGNGERLVRPADAKPGTVTPENPDYTPKPVGELDKQLCNLLMGFPVPQRSTPVTQWHARMARENGLEPSLNENGVEITNPLYADLVKGGFDPKILNAAVENLPVKNFTSELKPRTDIKSAAGDVAITRAGFMPRERSTPESLKENPTTREVANEYLRSIGNTQRQHEGNVPVNAELAKRIADFYHEAQSAPEDPAVQKAYAALADETMAQYRAMEEAGIQIEPYTGKGEPYANSAAMRKDVAENKHLYFYKTDVAFGADGKITGDNALLQPSGVTINGHELLVNDVFRAVHDYFGHTTNGYEFGPRGELNAYLQHSKMFSKDAKPALAAETLAQNSWVNFGPHLRREDGTIPQQGEEGYVPLKDRPFGEQKNILIPERFIAEAEGRPVPKEEVKLALPSKAGKLANVAPPEDNTSFAVKPLEEAPKESGFRRGVAHPEDRGVFMPRKPLQHTGERLEHAVGGELKLIHFGNSGMKEVDPAKFGKSGLTPRSELSGIPRSYFYEQGSHNAKDPVAGRGAVFGARVSGDLIYDGNKDPLGWGDMPNREKADRMLQDEGYVGVRRTAGKTKQVELFEPTKVTPIDGPRGKFMPKPSPAQEKVLKDSAVRGADGKLLPLFHGTYSNFKKFRQGDLGYHFGTQDAANARIGKAIADVSGGEIPAEQGFDAFPEMRDDLAPGARGALEGIAEGARHIPVFLDIKNPLRMRDVGPWDNPEEVLFALPPKVLSALPKSVGKAVDAYKAWENDYAGAMNKFNDAKVLQAAKALTAIREGLKSLGYDGVVYHNAFEGGNKQDLAFYDGPPIAKNDSYIAFDNKQIVPAYSADAKARFMPKTDSLGFYSNIEKSLEDWQPKGTPEQLLAHLAKTGGTKEEAGWIGLDDFLKGKKSVTKDEVAKFVAENTVQLEEVTHGGLQQYERYLHKNPEETAYQNDGQDHYDVEIPNSMGRVNRFTGDRQSALEYAASIRPSKTKYENYTLPGGENYREHLLTMPPEADPVAYTKAKEATKWQHGDLVQRRIDAADARRELLQYYGTTAEGLAQKLPYSSKDGSFGGSGPSWDTQNLPPAEARLWRNWDHLVNEQNIAESEQTRLRRAEDALAPNKASTFKSGHWEEPNIVVHTRTTDRTTPGEHKDAAPNTLFLEEVQSDLHQKGRQEGYMNPKEKAAAAKEYVEAIDNLDTKQQVLRAAEKTFDSYSPTKDTAKYYEASDLMEAARKEYDAAQMRVHAARSRHADFHNAVPDFPFKTSWPKLALKRMIALAAQEGKDQIAWTTGEQQAARYDLSKQISRVELQSPRPDHPDQPNYLSAYDNEGRRVIDAMVGTDHSNIEDYIGKEMTKKLIEQPWKSYDTESSNGIGMTTNHKVLSGLDLKIGGEGMKGFYDKILPEIANQIGKKYGAKVGTTQLESASAEDAPIGQRKKQLVTVHALTLTPALREAALSGQPLFMPKPKGDHLAVPGEAQPQDVLNSKEYRDLARGLTDDEAKSIRRDTAQSMVDIFKELPPDEEFMAAAKAGMMKKGWYSRAAATLKTVFGTDTERFVGLLAATSPRQSVQENLNMALKIWNDWQDAGRPQDTKSLTDLAERHANLHARVPNSVRALRGMELVDEPGLSGYKVESFRKNLLGDMSAVTNDSWMAQFGNIDQAKFGTKAGYLAYTAKVRRVAKKLDMTPAEVQETVWSFFKTLKEGTNVNRGSREALRSLSDSDILNTPEFHDQIVNDPSVRAQLERLGFTGFDALSRPADSARSVPRAGSLAEVGREEGGTRRLGALGRIADRAQALHDAELPAVRQPRKPSLANAPDPTWAPAAEVPGESPF